MPETYQYRPLTLATGKSHTVKLPPQVFRARWTGLLFETDKAFLLPAAMAGIRGIRRYYDQHPGLQVLVTGHTDTVGDATYNEGLASERAEAVAAFLSDAVEPWLAHYSGSPSSKPWATREDQYMLSALPADGEPYYAGPVDGVPGPATSAAIVRFQREHGLADDGVAGPDTRRALITDYMALDGTSLPPGTPLATHGCGEAHPTVPTPDSTDEPANRRVEVFLFEGPIDPPPRAPCRTCPEYPEWVRRTVHTLDLGDDPGWLDVAIVDGLGQPLADVRIAATGPTSAAGVTAADGTLRLDALAPGRYRVTAEHPRFDPAGTEIDIRAGYPAGDRAPPPDPAPAPPSYQLVDAPPDDRAAPATRHGLAQDGDGAPAADSPKPGQSSELLQAGDNRLVGMMMATIHLLIREEPAALRDSARENSGPAADQPWAQDRLLVVASYDGRTSAPYPMSVWPMDDGSKRGHSGIGMPTGPTSIGLTAALSLERTGPHAAPIIWQLDPPGPLNDTGWATDKVNTIERAMSGRARISLWANGTEVIDAQMRDTGAIAKGRGIVDDVSLIAGLFNDHKDGTSAPTFRLTSPAGQALAHKWYAKIVDTCHAAGVQVLAGWGLPDVITEGTDPGPDGYSGKLNRWLRYLYALRNKHTSADDATVKSQLAQCAASLIQTADQIPGWDGLSFDLESIHFPIDPPPTKGLSDRDKATVEAKYEADVMKALPVFRTVVADMYRAVAAGLAVTNRICAVAIGGNHDDDHAQLVPRPVRAVPFARVHSFDIAKGAPNLVLRAMSYDNADWDKAAKRWKVPDNNSDPGQMTYHRGVIDFALDTKRLHPGQFQLGIKTLKLPSAEDNSKLPNPMLGGNVSESDRLVARATELLRPARVGAAWFTMGTSDDFYAKVRAFDQALNGPPAIASATLGQPMQVPHDAATLARIKR